jgi:hypothetical protein
MATLPPEFRHTTLGTLLWIAHPGSSAQYRASPGLHAYELEDGWKIHRDPHDPGEDPAGHFLFDAPELAVSLLAAAATGVGVFLFLDGRERDKEEADRNPWVPVMVAVVAAVAVGILVYILAALVRVTLGIG